MRSFLLYLACILWACSSLAQSADNKSIANIEQTAEGYTLNLNFNDVTFLPQGTWHKILVPGAVYTLQAGAPQMPYMAYSFLVPEGDFNISVKNSSYVEYNSYDIIPSKGNITRDKDPADIPLVMGVEYSQNAFFPSSVAAVANEYSIRQAHGRAIHIYPVQYNPVTHKTRVYHSLELEIKTKHATRPVVAQPWENIYKHHFINYSLLKSSLAKSTYSAPSESGDMLIITQAMYLSAMQPFIDWKKQRGIRCMVMVLDTMTSGPDPDSIQARIADYYTQYGINYVLLVGDENDIPPMVNGNLAGPSDAAYGYVSGNDHYPDLLIGRFSANTLQELQPQINKSIQYERDPTASQSWYTRGMGIASNQGPGDDNQMDWEHINAIRTQHLAASYTYIYEAYDGDHDINIAPLDNLGDPNAQEVVNAFNAGVSLINYCGHGSSTSLGTTGFSNNDVASLTNTNGEWPFIMTVACVTGEFMNGNTSLGEKLMIAEQGGLPHGMVAGFMSSINQYWDPPMEGQDEVNAIISNNDSVKLYAAAALMAAGCMSMNDAYTGAGYDMTDAWIFFGDPSLQLRTEASDTLTAVHVDSIYNYETSLAVQLNKAYATVVLLHSDTLYSVEQTTTSYTTHNFAALPAGDSIMVIATAPNTKPYYGKVRVVDTPVTTLISTVGIEDAISLYPNPANSIVYVKGITAKTAYRCLDITGRLMDEGTLEDQNSSISTGKLVPGSYIIQLDTKGKKLSLPLQILR